MAAARAAALARERAARLDEEIATVANPTAENARARVKAITSRRRSLEEEVLRFRELDRYVAARQAAALLAQRRVEATSVVYDPRAINDLTNQIRRLLTAWRYPIKTDVFFSVQTNDLVIDGKDRSANGKGVRAVTHAAFTIGLMQHCLNHDTPHPGLTILDTPLTPFRGVTDEVDDPSLTQDVYTAFLHALATEEGLGQTIVMENIDPPEAVYRHATVHRFSGSDGDGRRGFYPPLP
jgi:hypothetical protein